MSISREELEAQGIFIPTEVNDELLARFRAGSKILIELLIPTYNFKVSYWTPVIISHDNNGLIFKDNNMCRFAQSDQTYHGSNHMKYCLLGRSHYQPSCRPVPEQNRGRTQESES